MRIIFLVLLLVSMGLAWVAWQQPAPGDDQPLADINLPRVSQLALWSESRTSVPEEREPVAAPEGPSLPEPPSADDSGVGAIDLAPPPLPEFFLPVGAAEALPEGGGNAPQARYDARRVPECLVISGFASQADAERWLAALTGSPQGRTDRRILPDTSWHWVLVPSQATRAEGLQLLKRLQQRGVDSYLITQPPQENAISLGLFKSRRAAETLMRQRRQEGLNAVLAEYERSREEHYVTVLSTDPERLNAELEEKLSLDEQTEACRVLH